MQRLHTPQAVQSATALACEHEARRRGAAGRAELERRVTLLTGASGYVGGHLLRALQCSGRRVRCLTRSPSALRDRVGPRTEVVEGDVLDPESLRRALRGVHAAC